MVPKQVRKRDGQTLQSFDSMKIRDAVLAAWLDAEKKPADLSKVMAVESFVSSSLSEEVVDVERIQDAVEVGLMRVNEYEVAKAYILYREKRANARKARKSPDPLAISEYIHASKYARHIPMEFRRELYHETVGRGEEMHLRRFAHIPSLLPKIRLAYDMVRAKRVLPSMRSMQFGGPAIEANNNRMYNCTATLVDRPRVFSEAMFLLLSGCVVGYSVQFYHVEKLPPIAHVDSKWVVHHVIQDSIEGWADAIDVLINSYITGYTVEFAYHLIRAAGVPLKTSGGRAPGHLKLKEALERIRGVLHAAQGTSLRPIQCHRIMCHLADAVLSGGIRRSAMICLFSLDDSEMMNAKSDRDWFTKEPWFANANNSVVLVRDSVQEKQFRRIFGKTRNFGEPGILFVSSIDHVTNPCCEIGLDPILVAEDGTRYTGWAFCNLCEINAALLKSRQDFMEAAWAATLIGTLQASYTEMPYLGWVSEGIARRDALLGVGMTGMQESPDIACDPKLQREVAQSIVIWNAAIAELIGINPAARTTTVKPSGTTTLELGIRASGIHSAHDRRYIRRVIADELEVVFQKFRETNPRMCQVMPNGKWVIEFPVETPPNARVRSDFSALSFMEQVRSTQQNWVVPGTVRESAVPGLRHNVSNTVTVRDGEWEDVQDFIWKNRWDLTGISLLSDYGDTIYPFAPFESVKTEAQERRWNELIEAYTPVDYTTMYEVEDGTALTQEAACAGGACAI